MEESRFASVSEDEIERLLIDKDSKNTKKHEMSSGLSSAICDHQTATVINQEPLQDISISNTLNSENKI